MNQPATAATLRANESSSQSTHTVNQPAADCYTNLLKNCLHWIHTVNQPAVAAMQMAKELSSVNTHTVNQLAALASGQIAAELSSLNTPRANQPVRKNAGNMTGELSSLHTQTVNQPVGLRASNTARELSSLPTYRVNQPADQMAIEFLSLPTHTVNPPAMPITSHVTPDLVTLPTHALHQPGRPAATYTIQDSPSLQTQELSQPGAHNPSASSFTGLSCGQGPTLQEIRGNQAISTQAANLMTSYDMQATQRAMSGKTVRTKTGCNATSENPMIPPQLRWPNESFINTEAKKIPFDDLSISQFAVGHISNCMEVDDMVLLKGMLGKFLESMDDATVMPWPAVRAAWGTSMTDIERGRLDWVNETKWTLNRVSSTNRAMRNAAIIAGNTNSDKGKPCKHFNKGHCTKGPQHGVFRHWCYSCFWKGDYEPHIDCGG